MIWLRILFASHVVIAVVCAVWFYIDVKRQFWTPPGISCDKTCARCSLHFSEIPADALDWTDAGSLIGYCFECSCGSHLFVKTIATKGIDDAI